MQQKHTDPITWSPINRSGPLLAWFSERRETKYRAKGSVLLDTISYQQQSAVPCTTQHTHKWSGKGMSSQVTKSDEAIKLLRLIKTRQPSRAADKFTKRSDWAIKWQMELNVDKYRVMHKEGNGHHFRYEKVGSDLVITSQERESWSYENGSMGTSVWCSTAAKKKTILRSVTKSVENKIKDIFLLPQKFVFCLHLLYR